MPPPKPYNNLEAIMPPPKPPKTPKITNVCGICGNKHEELGAYRCLNCGGLTCVGAALAFFNNEVIVKHAKKRQDYYEFSPGGCGPCIRVQATPFTRIRIRKVRL